jgi:hypothetical protein
MKLFHVPVTKTITVTIPVRAQSAEDAEAQACDSEFSTGFDYAEQYVTGDAIRIHECKRCEEQFVPHPSDGYQNDDFCSEFCETSYDAGDTCSTCGGFVSLDDLLNGTIKPCAECDGPFNSGVSNG